MKTAASTRSSRALTIGFGVLLLSMIGVTLVGIWRIYAINQGIQTVVHEDRVKSTLLASLLAVDRQRRELLYGWLADDKGPSAGEHAQYRALAGQLLATLDELQRSTAAATERAAIAEVVGAAVESHRVRDQVVQLLAQRQHPAASTLFESRGLATQDAFHAALYRLLEMERQTSLTAVAQASGEMREAWLLVALVGVLVLALGASISLAVTRQVTRREAALHREKDLAQVTLHSIGDGVITTDAEGHIEYMNPTAEYYTGWSSAEAHGQDLESVYRVVDQQTGKPLTYTSETPADQPAASGKTVRLLGKRDKSCPVRDSYAPIHGRDGELVGRVVVFHDVSEIQELAQQLTWQASHDALTGLVNRRECERRLAELIESAREDGRQHALMYMDLDNFKTVNDTCGHAAGDELLRQLTTLMTSRMRGSDTLARLGGDEFGGLLDSCPLEQAVRIANGLREAVRDFRFVWQDKTFGVGISIGLVPISADSGSVSRVLATADAMCYEAKNKGRDRVQVHRPHDAAAGPPSELQMVSQINHAFELGSFRLFRQKIMPLGAPDEAPHYEILVRMLDRSGNLVPPSGFMPAAERFNLLSSIERWVLSSLIEFLHRQYESGAMAREPRADAFYAVNLSAASISDASFPDFLRQLLTRYNLPRGVLCFEVTETTAISNLTKAAQLMHELKGMGCRFALDDFGIGMSSFAYLKYLPVDYIKIDGMFVRDMAADAMDYAIVEAINRIAHILGLKTVAEFVEDEATLDKLRGLGVDYAQGYFIAEPEALVKTADSAPAVLKSA